MKTPKRAKKVTKRTVKRAAPKAKKAKKRSPKRSSSVFVADAREVFAEVRRSPKKRAAMRRSGVESKLDAYVRGAPLPAISTPGAIHNRPVMDTFIPVDSVSPPMVAEINNPADDASQPEKVEVSISTAEPSTLTPPS